MCIEGSNPWDEVLNVSEYLTQDEWDGILSEPEMFQEHLHPDNRKIRKMVQGKVW